VLPGKQTLLKQKGKEKLMKVTHLTAHFQTEVEDRTQGSIFDEIWSNTISTL